MIPTRSGQESINLEIFSMIADTNQKHKNLVAEKIEKGYTSFQRIGKGFAL